MSETVAEYVRRIGAKGGAAGTGKKKVRGDAEHYKKLSQMAAKARARKK